MVQTQPLLLAMVERKMPKKGFIVFVKNSKLIKQMVEQSAYVLSTMVRT
jgi:hypothetical protein